MAISHADKRLFSETEREISCRRAQHMSAVVPHWPRIVGRGVLEVMGVMYVISGWTLYVESVDTVSRI